VRDVRFRLATPALSYLVLHTCTPGRAADGFDPFISYLNDGPGQPGPVTSPCP
jgi:hypothetical protein